MSATTKRAVLAALLAAVTLWPIVQIGLVTVYDVNAWKLGGWGMYSTPDLSYPIVRVRARRAGEDQDAEVFALPANARPLVERFQERRWALGKLCEPTRLARAVLDSEHEYEHVSVLVFDEVFDRETRMIDRVETVYEYRHTAGARSE